MDFKKTLTVIILAGALAFGGSNKAEAFPANYEITIFGDDGSCAYGINDSGQVVGQSGFESGREAFLWDNGVMESLGVLGSTVPGAHYSRALDINNSGQIVGYSTSEEITHELGERAFLWEDGNMYDLGSFGTESIAYAINELGWVVGESEGNGFFWGGDIESDILEDIGRLDDGDTYAYGINDYGQIVGQSYIPVDILSNMPVGFLLDDGGMSSLGYIDEYGSSASDINNNGQIVGYMQFRHPDAQIIKQARLWDDGEIINLGYLEHPESIATAINDLEQIVGYSRVRRGNGSFFHACLWEDEDILSLNGFFPPGARTQAYDINNLGQIVGRVEINNSDYGFLMTPVPEPITFSLFSIGSLILLRRRRSH